MPAAATHRYVCLDCAANFDVSASGDLPEYVPVRCACGSQNVIEAQ